ncbi:MAG: DNA-directed RNA polymerase subunit alpha [Candidatus Liptonbacteria bacterium RIFCSPLOWO2_01_FULL_53_13]|uniref:DNA-directed RNA polymerase subunit alpha n=1 Tax=Candidatus Liptonbacteria bacterium RIFCSPLOWO2_01_FULL_53_13 TaxID=1798651 RepID=A0A1G2CPC5_9BACT|nr:MAG: DNA-directed RNA polymerase subunit alpha [Candidatus Liptonbacteria bacterium RIFCSPLOWO2_01_FULL_53_13]
MEFAHLVSTVSVKTVTSEPKHGVFEIEGLYAGYGLTIGNALRRTLLSSLPGAAVTYVKIKNAPHEFTTIQGIKEDVVELTLNLKKLRFRMHTNEPQTLLLKVKGIRTATGADIEKNSEVELINSDEVIATLTEKGAELDMEITVERGLGYSSVESRKAEKLSIGLIGIDAFFSPVTKVSYTVDNMRMGDRTDYNRLRVEIDTDGTISPSAAFHKTASILKDHFEKVFELEVQNFEAEETKEEAPKKKARTKKIKE